MLHRGLVAGGGDLGEVGSGVVEVGGELADVGHFLEELGLDAGLEVADVLLGAGAVDGIERELRRLLEQLNYPPEQCALLSERKLAGLPPIKRGEFVRHLGLSYLCVVVDAFSGLNPSALAQAAGTLKGGGVLILLTPKAEHWADFDDPEYAYIGASDRPAGHFIQWLKTH